MKIYAIQRGRYSDKKIITCTNDYEKALKVKEIYDRVDDCVTIFTFEDCQEITLPMFEITINKGLCEKRYTSEATWCEDEDVWYDNETNGEHTFFVRAESKEQAEKIALDKFYIWKAQKENLI